MNRGTTHQDLLLSKVNLTHLEVFSLSDQDIRTRLARVQDIMRIRHDLRQLH